MVSGSWFEHQRTNRHRTVLVLAIGALWMISLGAWGVLLQVKMAHWVTATLEWEPWLHWPHEQFLIKTMTGVLIALGLWALAATILLLRANSVLPTLVNATEATGEAHAELRSDLKLLQVRSGIPKANVDLYVWEDRAVANAFACGLSPRHGSIILSQGLLDMLNRNERLAVMAHELAHLQNRDAMCLVQAIAFVALAFLFGFLGVIWAVTIVAVATALGAMAVALICAPFNDSGGDSDGGGCIVALIVFMLGILALVKIVSVALGLLVVCVFVFGLATLICALGVRAVSSATSQSREHLADACAAQWTNAADLGSALRKLVGHPQPVSLKGVLLKPLLFRGCSSDERTTFFQEAFDWLYMTHPDIDDRVGRLRLMTPGGGGPELENASWGWHEWYLPLALSGVLLTAAIWAFPKTKADYEWWLTPVRPNYTSSQVTTARPQFVPIAVDAVKVRQGPAETFQVVTILRRGVRVEVLESRGPDARGLFWYHVRLNSGRSQDGWIWSGAIRGSAAGTSR